jgi:hypothetical protein
MAFTGKNSVEAEMSLLSFCSHFGGSPEATDEGTIVYRFDDLLLRAESKNFTELSPPVKRLKVFSLNTKKMNVWFILINAVNLIFGSYFLFHSINTGHLFTEAQYHGASFLYAFTHFFLDAVAANPHVIIGVFLGIVPLVFSLFFWIIPAIRHFMEKKENEGIKLSNFKKIGFSKIWFNPINFQPKKIIPQSEECRPADIEKAGDRVIKELGAISEVDVEQSENGEYFYSFRALEKERHAIDDYRRSIDPERSKLGSTVFDTMKKLN